MIKFFRRIRQKQLAENRVSKYLLYAIGEIVLVMIGILLAIQVNDWNENRKLKAQEIIILKNFKTSIQGDSITLPKYQKFSLSTPNSISILLESFKQNLSYHDSLSIHFGNVAIPWDPSIITEIFKSMNSTELDLISSPELKKEIISYYSFAESQLHPSTVRYLNIIENASKDIFSSRFNSLWDGITKQRENPMIPNDYEALKNDDEYLYFLRTLRNQFDLYIRQNLQFAIGRSNKILKAIDNELQKLN